MRMRSLLWLGLYVPFYGACANGSPDAQDEEDASVAVVRPDAGPQSQNCEPNKCPAGYHDLDKKAIGPNCGCEYACTRQGDDDPLDPEFVDSNCDGIDGIQGQCIFVSTSLGNDGAADGTAAKPFKTIQQAIQFSFQEAKKRPVCVSAETYAENLELKDGVGVYGGFDQANPDSPFRRSKKRGGTELATVLNAAAVSGPLAGTGVFAADMKQETHFENFTVNVSLPDALDGASLYGVRMVGSAGALIIRGNLFNIGAGHAGAPGAPGSQFASAAASGGNGGGGCSDCSSFGAGAPAPACINPGGSGGNGTNSTNDGSGGTTGAGLSGGPGGGGGGGKSCISPGSGGGGGGGSPGGPGSDGVGGGAGGGDLGRVSAVAEYVPARGANGIDGLRGSGGGGGGGGGSSAHTFPFCYDDGSGGGGAGGCGGDAGRGGGGGGGGGGSFGVLVLAGKATVVGNRFLLGAGGAGGAGAVGSPGQLGGQGGNGGAGGGAGGSGGRGGNGGPGGGGTGGGGGGGGPSARVAKGPTAVLTEGNNTGSNGAPGTAGAAGAGGGTAGAGRPGSAGRAEDSLLLTPQ